jgi:cyclic beta-1,2-glucan synthetase
MALEEATIAPSAEEKADLGRSELDYFESLATQLAQDHPSVSPDIVNKPTLLERLHVQERLLKETYKRFANASLQDLAISQAGEWFLDNNYIVQEAIRLVREDMPEGFYRQLPKLEEKPDRGLPRVYSLASSFLSDPHTEIESGIIQRFVNAYQKITPLSIGELWAFPVMLRIAVLDHLESTASHILDQLSKEVSDEVSDEVSSTSQVRSADINEGALVGTAILNLRSLGAMDWKTFVEQLSLVDQTLCEDPAGIYSEMDFETRDHYRQVVEEIAKLTDRTETEVALEVIRLSSESSNHDLPNPVGENDASGEVQSIDNRRRSKTTHVGFYLIDSGREELETRLNYRGSWLSRLRKWASDRPILPYLSSIGMLSMLLMIATVSIALPVNTVLSMRFLVGVITFVPAITIAVNIVNWIVTHNVAPQSLPKMDFSYGIPRQFSTMIVIPSMLTNKKEVDSLLKQLELHYLSNPDGNLYFALLTDFADAPERNMPSDQILVQRAKDGVDQLNKHYPKQNLDRFSLFHRDRVWNSGEGRWIGWERKRGKLAEFNSILLGEAETSYSEIYTSIEDLGIIRYVITLDGDTILPEGNARRLIGTIAHPLNQADFQPETGNVISGYTILQPRVVIQPSSSNQTIFTRIFSGDTALDLYSRAVSDVYQDLFGEGIYVGKGIYEVASFERSLIRRIPDNTLLSHDLFEGIHGRAGLATDITLLEDFPPHYLAFAQRMHRWLRGDWQLIPWLMPRVPRAGGGSLPNRLSGISRWKLLDNLRRSLLMPTLMVLAVAGWTFLPGASWIWSLIPVIVLSIPWLMSLAAQMGTFVSRIRQGQQPPSLNTAFDFWRWVLALSFLPFEALISIMAIISTLFRLTISRQGMLQWTTSAESARQLGRQIKAQVTLRQMAAALIFISATGFLVWWLDPSALVGALPLLILWMISPQVAYYISQPQDRMIRQLSKQDQDELRSIARRTWLFFEDFVGPEDQWLPPDHFQEDPLGLVAHRTSPTNIGLMMLTTLAAHDLGYLGPTGLSLRLSATFDTLDRVERYRGHILNWYNTRDLTPLLPRYVSTVDNGNFAASLLILKSASTELPHTPILRWERWQGLLDSLTFLEQIFENLALKDPAKTKAPLEEIIANFRRRILSVREHPKKWAKLWFELAEGGWEDLNHALLELLEHEGDNLEAPVIGDLRICTDLFHVHLFRAQREIDMLLPWLTAMHKSPSYFEGDDLAPEVVDAWEAILDEFPATPTLTELPGLCQNGKLPVHDLLNHLEGIQDQSNELNQAKKWCLWVEDALDAACQEAEGLLESFKTLAERAEQEFQRMDFSFLFNEERQIFHIGYHVDTGRLDANFYDLLASEARLASLVAMAKRDIPQSHWLHLSRPLTSINGSRVLLSWSGTMFEYLMPSLFAEEFESTLIYQSANSAIKRQVEYGQQNNVPWGISESGYYAFDANMFYQYRAFGVPPLGFKRGLGEDLVVSPYASILGLRYQPEAVMDNIRVLYEMDMMGRYGFFEAVDFTPSRLPFGSKRAIVRSYMAHHQGMILLSIANYLQGDRMVRRFHADPRIKGVELLLQERIPTEAPTVEAHQADVSAARPEIRTARTTPWTVPVQSNVPQVHYLSNGNYSVSISSSGAGFSRYGEVDLTRWRADTTLENWGTWIYIHDLDQGDLWSATFQPTSKPPDRQNVTFEAHRAEFWRQDGDITSRLEVGVAPSDDTEIRRISITNHGTSHRRLMLSSYAEVILADQSTDRRHPAFNKMFIESEFLPDLNTLLFRRRPRSSDEDPLFLAHFLILDSRRSLTKAHETDRLKFLGRGRNIRNPIAFDLPGEGLTATTGATLDPVMALGQLIELKPSESAQLAWITIAASTREEVLTLVDRYRSWPILSRAFDRARSQSEFDLRQAGTTTSELENMYQMLSSLFYPHPSLRAEPGRLAANSKGQSGLWPYTISGDYPILLVKIENDEETQLVNDVLRAHAYWRKRGLKIDLVIMNRRETGYSQELHNQIARLVSRLDGDAWLNRRGGIFLLREDQLSGEDRILLEAVSRVILHGSAGSLSEQLERRDAAPPRLPLLVPTLPSTIYQDPPEPLSKPSDLQFDNGYGGFSPDGREYVIYLPPGVKTPAPWVNVIANEEFGFIMSEAGSGSTWAENSGENRLTPWKNDPVSDPPSEALYLRDEETGSIWTPTPTPAGATSPYLVRHGAGYSQFEHRSHDLDHRLRTFAVANEPLKVIQLQLTNSAPRSRRLTATYYAEWVLGTDRDQSQAYVITEFDSQTQALLAHNPYNPEFSQRVAFLAGSLPIQGLTGDRTEFLGRMGKYQRPGSLELVGLSGTVKAGLDPCAAIMIHIDLAPNETKEFHFILGQGHDRATSLDLVATYREPESVDKAWRQTIDKWDALLNAVQVKTPEPAMDILLNRWLLYQSLSSRIWGRSAFYQSSGAFGFRDQLQDVMAFVHNAPSLGRKHILETAHHQFEDGDVLHWWHPPEGRGVRTRITDDLLWLPFVTAHYVSATGDIEILEEKISFLSGNPLEDMEEERYGLFKSTDDVFSLYEHCKRAIERGSTSGSHGIPLIGTGDWNDGMNRVGIQGRGESVWLGWFLYATLTRFAPISDWFGDSETSRTFLDRAKVLRNALETHAWDGEWYLRAFYDDGTPIGSTGSDENQIDSIAQSWAVLSGGAEEERGKQALQAVLDRLVRREDRLMLLFSPPFDKTGRDPGYIKGYLPGIRENGGQYTHGVQWAVWALAQNGRGGEAEELFKLLNPILHGQNPDKYRVEPYVVAADIYSTPPHVGRGGWTWYTGSAAWLYRLGLEGLLGLTREGGTLRLDPRIPPDWPGFEIEYRWGDSIYHIDVQNRDSVTLGVKEITLDGKTLKEGLIPLIDDGKEHEVQVTMG